MQTTLAKLEHVALSNYQTDAATAATPTNLTTGKTRPLTTEGYRDRRKTTEYVSRQTHLFCRLENFDFKQYCLFRTIIHATKRTGKICSRSCTRLRSIRSTPRPCDRPANSHQGDPNTLSSLSRAGSMVIQQDNTRPSTSLNTFIDKASPETTSQRTRVERLIPLQTHTAATIFPLTTNTLPQSKPPSPQKTRRVLSSDSPAKTTKTSINIAFLSPFHVKHRLKSHISTPLNPSALPHDRRHQTTKHIGQCKHASIVLPRSILRLFTYSAPLSL